MTMQVFAPVSRADEVAPLVEAGAGELYCGVYDEAWARRWGLAAWPNRRGPGPGNLGSTGDLTAVAVAASEAGVPLYLALNNPLMDADQEEVLVEMAHQAVELGVKGVIAGQPGLIQRLRTEDLAAKIVASTLCTARNTDAVRHLAELGAQRVILSRQLTLPEIAAIRAGIPDVELEVFVLADACAFEEGSCQSAHALPGCEGVYCLAPRRATWGDQAHADHRSWLQALGSRGFTATGLPLVPCGLCALPDLWSAGIDAVKVVGREAHPYRKVRLVQMVRHVLDGLRRDGPDAARARAVSLRDDPAGCAAGWHCYYPAVRPR